MILKVWNEGTMRWCLIDGIKSIEVGTAFMLMKGLDGGAKTNILNWKEKLEVDEETREDTGFHPDYDFTSSDLALAVIDGKAKSVRISVAVMEMRHGDSQLASFTGKAYLLNDDGKTIERL